VDEDETERLLREIAERESLARPEDDYLPDSGEDE
jgi:hypothetical protein